MINSFLLEIQKALKNVATTEQQKKSEWYLKKAAQFHGVRSPDIDACFKEYFKSTLKDQMFSIQFKIALSLLTSEFHEEKKFGILLLHKNIKLLNESHITSFSKLFPNDIKDWATCDSFSSKVLTNMIKQNPAIAQKIYEWRNSNHLWQQRASCIAFVVIARHGEYNDMIISICRTVIKNPERFAQLGAGWVLRELSLADLDLVLLFIKKNYEFFSREGLRYAIEKMKPEMRKAILANDY